MIAFPCNNTTSNSSTFRNSCILVLYVKNPFCLQVFFVILSSNKSKKEPVSEEFSPHQPADLMSGDLLADSSFHQQSDQFNLKKPSSQPDSTDSRGTSSVTSTSVRGSLLSGWLLFPSSSNLEQTCAAGLSRPVCSSEGLPGPSTPSLPQLSSMFETGEDFDEFLPATW